MDTTATSVLKVMAMQFTMRMTSTTQTMIGLKTPTTTMRKATMKMRPALKIPLQQLLIAMWTRPIGLRQGRGLLPDPFRHRSHGAD